MRKVTTKERIVDEALTLFSIKGFKGTSVKSIADAVGIKDASLYKHFKSKQEILDTIVGEMKRRVDALADAEGMPLGVPDAGVISAYAAMSVDVLVEYSKKAFLFYLRDSFMLRFWRMGNIEQYQNPAVYRVFYQFFFEDSIEYLTHLFSGLAKEGILKEVEPGVMALSFYAPIFFLLSKYANLEGREEEALENLERQVREFFRVYGTS